VTWQLPPQRALEGIGGHGTRLQNIYGELPKGLGRAEFDFASSPDFCGLWIGRLFIDGNASRSFP
jgi:hypothetical protein